MLQVSTKGNHNQGIPDTGGADGMNDRKGGTAMVTTLMCTRAME